VIYEAVNIEEPVRQGDIFYPVPFITINLNKLAIVDKEGHEQVSNWLDSKDNKEIIVKTAIKPMWGIVATQDCDAEHSPYISLFEIRPFSEVTTFSPKSPKKWMELITKKSRMFAKWFYLPQDNDFGFADKMAVNFLVLFQVSREGLMKNIKELRKGRLKEVAYEHYRESIAQLFRRYPYDEWYSLNKGEFSEYKERKGSIEPFPWQK